MICHQSENSKVLVLRCFSFMVFQLCIWTFANRFERVDNRSTIVVAVNSSSIASTSGSALLVMEKMRYC